MKKNLKLIIAFLLMSLFGFSQNDKFWTNYNSSIEKTTTDKGVSRQNFPKEFKLFVLKTDVLRNELFSIVGNNPLKHSTIISLPNVKGQLEQFEVFEASNFESDLQAQFPEIRAYSGKGITDKYASLKLSISPQGIQTMVFRTDNLNEFIEPYSQDHTLYAVFKSYREKTSFGWNCSTEDQKFVKNISSKVSSSIARSSAGQLKTMRLAQSCTAEYSNYFGATNASQVGLVLSAFNATLTRCNGVYERDLGLHLNLISQSTNVIFYSAATDPYSDAAVGTANANANNTSGWNIQLQNTLSSTLTGIGTTLAANNAVYDIGHLFGASGGGGNAGCIGCVCVDDVIGDNKNKGSGFTSPGDGVPQGDNFDIDYVVHEVGHQLGANHTFSFSNEGYGVNKEVGSGVTIMGYAGITPQDVAPHSIPYYHETSIEQIQVNLATKTCPITTSLSGNNATPSVAAVANYTIPKSTPFVLTGSATDANISDVLTYSWEQNDDGSTNTGASSIAIITKTVGPNFISWAPTTSPSRYFPALSSILANSATTLATGNDSGILSEALSSVSRILNFRLTVRDNVPYSSTSPIKVGQTSFTDMAVTVNGSVGPFEVTSQATDGISWLEGSTQTITWSVNNTTSLAGSTNVDILLSTDGGLTYTTPLATGIPNNGSAVIIVPNIAAPFCRVMVKPTGNIYFDVNSKSFSIGYTLTNVCNTYTNTTSQNIPDGPDPNNSIAGPTLTSIINIPINQTISDVNVNVNVTHEWIRDLVSKVVHPDGTTVILGNRICNSQDGYNITFNDGSPAIVCTAPITSGTFTPNQALSAFNTKPTNGNWSLLINDFFQVDTGTLNSWSIEVCYIQATPLLVENFGLENFNIYPNPNNGNFNIEFNSNSTNEIMINIYDMRGREIFNKKYQNSGLFNENIQLNKVQSGVYLINVQDGNKKETKKIIIE